MDKIFLILFAVVLVSVFIGTADAGKHDYHIDHCDATCKYSNRLSTKVGGKGTTCQECCKGLGYEKGQCNGTYGFLTRKCRCKPKSESYLKKKLENTV